MLYAKAYAAPSAGALLVCLPLPRRWVYRLILNSNARHRFDIAGSLV